MKWLRPLIFFAALLIAAAVAYHQFKNNSAFSGVYTKINRKTSAVVSEIKAELKAEPKAPEGPLVRLKLKSGWEFEGIFVRENEEGQWLFIEGTGEVFFSVREIAEAYRPGPQSSE